LTLPNFFEKNNIKVVEYSTNYQPFFYGGQFCLRDVIDAPMVTVAGSKGIKMKFPGLVSGQWYLLFVRAIGPLDTGNWSIGFPYLAK
jgi:hypothetical protein